MPVFVRLVSGDADEKYVVVTEYTSADEPTPIIGMGVEMDLEKIAEGMDKLKRKEKWVCENEINIVGLD